MEKKIIIGVIILAVLVLVAAFFGQSITGQFSLSSFEEKEYLIGATLPLTGELASFGSDVRQSIELAVSEINSNGGINGSKLIVEFEDDQCDKVKAVTNVEAFSAKGISIILGPFCSGASLGVAPLAEKKNLIFMSGAATNPVLSNYSLFFRTIPSDSYQGKFAAEYAYNTLGKKTVAISSVQNDYAFGVKEAFKNRFVELGGKVLIELEHAEKSTDLRTEVAKIKELSPELIFLTPYIVDGGSFLKQAREIGLNVLVLAPESVEDPKIIEIAQGAAEGLLFTKPKNNQSSEFANKYQRTFGSVPGAYGAFWYDGTKALASAITKCSKDTSCIKSSLVDSPAFSGASGVIDFDEKGDIVGAEYLIKIIKNGEFVEYK
jgi:branched-chain amino acid transport system substrate-binding protein